jgi:iron complex outermembrane receptor protein
VPTQYLKDEPTYNPAGTEKQGRPYGDQVDDYRQTHSQLIYNQELSKNWNFSLTGHYTRGLGYYEEYKAEQFEGDYGILVVDDLPPYPDIVRRRWLDNHFFGGIGNLSFQSSDQKLQAIVGGAWNQYLGEHYGKVVEASYVFFDPEFRYYNEDGDKRGGNVFLKTQYALLPSLSGFVDLQVRKVDYEIGVDNVFASSQPDRLITTSNYTFFNPKAGLFCEANKNTSIYASFAVAQKEPNRDDFTDAPEGKTPKPERLYNSELGMKYRSEQMAFGVNLYHMLYRDQLVLTGNINDSGAPIRINVPDSYRAGVELTGRAQLGTHFVADANATFSQNKIKDFTEYVDDWDTGEQTSFERGTTDIALSPSVVAFGRLTWGASQNFAKDGQGLSVALAGKHVGKQYLDNTSNENTVLDAYTTFEAQIRYVLRPSFCKELSFNLLVQNLLDTSYSSNAWTYRYHSSEDYSAFDPYTRSEGGNFYNLTGYFPQAGRNFLLGVTVGF